MLVSFIKKYRVAWAVITLLLNALALALVVVVFPDVSNLWVSIFVLFGAVTASVTTLAELLVSAEEAERDDIEEGHQSPEDAT